MVSLRYLPSFGSLALATEPLKLATEPLNSALSSFW